MIQAKFFLAAMPAAVLSLGIAGCKSPSEMPQNQGAVGGLGGTESQITQTRPATPEDVFNSATADLNGDGFVTLDEVVAMQQADLTDDQMLQRLRDTNQIFVLTASQENYLRNQGVSNYVITQMETINRDQRQQLLNNPAGGTPNPPGNIISLPPPQ
ncbi:MAG: hypothetical protein JWQ04_70 [Pedosphaera sp.]|nr:hypothetical protein [Pedosphaera sp.]